MHPSIRRLARFFTAHLDAPLLGATLLLMGMGLIVLYSASNASFMRVSSQLMNMLVALGVMWLFANMPPHYLMRLSVPVYVVGLVLLLGVALFGDVVNGARRWLHVGVTRIQPSELMKIAVPLMLAWYFDRYEATLKLKNYVIGAVMLIVPVAFIARQPDLGTAVLIFASGCYVLFLAGLSWRVIAGLFDGGRRVPAARLVGAPRLPAPAPAHAARSFAGPAGLGLSHDTVDDRGRLRRARGQRLAERLADASRFHSRAHDRFHFRGLFGGVRSDRQCDPARALPARDRARRRDHRERADAFRAAPRRRDHADVLHLCVRQHGHGERHPAGGRRAAAARELRRHVARDNLSRIRHPDEHTNAQEARSDREGEGDEGDERSATVKAVTAKAPLSTYGIRLSSPSLIAASRRPSPR